MKNLKNMVLILLSVGMTFSGCTSLNKTQKGAAVGTATGGAMGAVIGRTSGNTGFSFSLGYRF